jgi:hypothetical protein
MVSFLGKNPWARSGRWRTGWGYFSTGVHSFAQIFCGKLIDGVRHKIYLARQIEPEARLDGPVQVAIA